MISLRLTFIALFLGGADLSSTFAAELMPPQAHTFVSTYCAECHVGDATEGDFSLNIGQTIDWQDAQSLLQWERIYNELHHRRMPPGDADQPSGDARQQMLTWLETQLTKHSMVGGTVPRRLNRTEYQNTIRDLFDWPEFEIPDAFPSDDVAVGFDNIGEGLILSPPLMAQYVELANKIADELLPPDRGPVIAESKPYWVGVQGLATSAGGELSGGRFRLVGSQNMASFAAWPQRFEATQSGIYRLTVSATTYQTETQFYEHWNKPFQLAVYSRPKTAQVYDKFDDIRRHAEFKVQPNQKLPQSFTSEIKLYAGEMFGLRWENGPMFSEPGFRECSDKFYDDRMRRSRRHYAAMLQYKGGPRGTTRAELYDATTALINSDALDLSDPRLDELPETYGAGLSNLPHAWIKKFVLEELHRHGPALDVTQVHIEGPLRLVEDDIQLARKVRAKRFLQADIQSPMDSESVPQFMQRFLTQAFRRTVTDDEVNRYVELVERHMSQHADAPIEFGLHLAVRRALVSPHFLYRATRNGRLDDFDLANRLSYFLTSSPPDQRLFKLASEEKLLDAVVLRQETERLLSGSRSENFIHNFTSHWLGTRLLRDIMPDPRLLKFYDPDREAMISETELFFGEILRENHPIETFIDPGFSYRNANLNKIYGGDLKGPDMQRITFTRGGREGGVLSLASVMMATANGVDTHPVHRGVWLLENVFGTPPPPPPDNVPAIAPDTTGTSSIRSQLNAHRADESCASCHRKIDPLGMVLENFDPVGRWREHYPVYTNPSDGPLKKEFYSTVGEGTKGGPLVDAVGTMPDGTRLQDVAQLKQYVLKRIDMFSACLAEKLLTYATGRPLSFGDRRVVDEIIPNAKQNGNGFRDLVVAIVLSDAFGTK